MTGCYLCHDPLLRWSRTDALHSQLPWRRRKKKVACCLRIRCGYCCLDSFRSWFLCGVRLMCVTQVTVPPGPLGVVLDGEVGDRPVVLEVQGVSSCYVSLRF